MGAERVLRIASMAARNDLASGLGDFNANQANRGLVLIAVNRPNHLELHVILFCPIEFGVKPLSRPTNKALFGYQQCPIAIADLSCEYVRRTEGTESENLAAMRKRELIVLCLIDVCIYVR